MAAKETKVQKALFTQKLKQNIVRKKNLKREWTYQDITDYLNSISPNMPKISVEQVKDQYLLHWTEDYQRTKVWNKIVDKMFHAGIVRLNDFLQKVKKSPRKKNSSDHAKFEKIINDSLNTDDDEKAEPRKFRKFHSQREGSGCTDSSKTSKLDLGSQEDITAKGKSEKKESTPASKISDSEIHPTVLEEKMAVTDSSWKQADLDTQEDLTDFIIPQEIQE